MLEAMSTAISAFSAKDARNFFEHRVYRAGVQPV
jgi:hypothetical protein